MSRDPDYSAVFVTLRTSVLNSVQRIERGLAFLAPHRPITPALLEGLSDQEHDLVTALIKHYENLFEAVLVRGLRTYFVTQGIDTGAMTPIDILNLAEKHGLVDDARQARAFAQLRNHFVHTYPSLDTVLADRLEQAAVLMPQLVYLAHRLLARIEADGLIPPVS